MGRKWRNVMIGVAIAIVVVLVGILVVKVTLNNKPKETEVTSSEESEAEIDVYGRVDPATVGGLVAQFNQDITKLSDLGLVTVDDGAMVMHENAYWYPLEEDLALVVVPVEFSGDKEKDTALTTLIYVDKASMNQARALEYLRVLVQANDAKLSEDEISGLVNEAEKLRERGEMANRGNGIFVAIHGTDDHYEYQVIRNYQDE